MHDSDSVITIPRHARIEGIVARALRRLEGRHAWGYVESGALSRGTWMRDRLTILPPGTTAVERRELTFHRNWPVAGAVAALLVMLLLGDLVAPPLACGAAFTLYGLVLWQSGRSTRRLRAESVRLAVITVAIGGGVRSFGNVETLASTGAALALLDRRAATEGLTAAQYEHGWATIFLALDARRSTLDDEMRRGILDSERAAS